KKTMFNLAGGDITKPYCKSFLEGRANESLDRDSWLLSTCNDVAMDRVIEQILKIQPMVVVRQSEVECTKGIALSAAVRSSIDDAVNKRGIRQFMLCGHSLCSAIPLAKRQSPSDSTSGGFAGPIERMRQREELNRLARETVVRQLSAIETCLTCDHGLDWRHFVVHGMCYLEESGILTIYDRPQQRFVAVERLIPFTG
ncbi:MAG: hypothetical protein SGJ20_03460, partial [Planctomycetota bacterium]|nr:hypothetical protein [Planctomycetota bacterium]